MTDQSTTENAASGGTCAADCSADAFDPEDPICTNCGDPMFLEPGWEWPEEPELCVCHECAHILFEELWREKQNPEIISAYTRADALEEGEQVNVSELAAEAGFKFPVFMTRGAYDATITAGGKWIPADDGDGDELSLPYGQDVTGRLWDVFSVLLWRIRAGNGNGSEIRFNVSVYAYDGKPHRRDVSLVSQCGPMDADDPAPAITIMLPGEE